VTPPSIDDVATERWLSFHDVPVRLARASFPGDVVSALLRPFPTSARDDRALTIDLRAMDQVAPGLDEEGWDPSFCHGLAQGYSREARHRLTDGQSLLEIDPPAGRMMGWLRGPPVSELARGMQHVSFCLLLRERGLFDAHAAVACRADRAVLLLGDAGSGKTTTLLALLSAGGSYLGDDRVLLRRASSGVELLGYPRDFHLAPQTLAAHRHAEEGGSLAAIDGKWRVDAERAWPGRFLPRFQGGLWLVSPLVGEAADTTCSPLSRADAFGLLLSASASVALAGVTRRDEHLALLSDLASSAIAAAQVTLGRDVLLDPRRAGERLWALLEATHG
jgi:hypothetical protein